MCKTFFHIVGKPFFRKTQTHLTVGHHNMHNKKKTIYIIVNHLFC